MIKIGTDLSWIDLIQCLKTLPFQIVSHTGFYRFIAFIMHLDITYISVHSKNNISKNARITYNLKWRE